MIPKYLYHYTSVDALIAILENQTIRFTRLDLLNDPCEGHVEIKDVPEAAKTGKFKRQIYCSCWNDCPDENIALWYMYTNMEGVRIKLKAAMFGEKMMLKECKSGYIPVTQIFGIYASKVKKDEVPINNVQGPIKIQYVDNDRDLYSNAVFKSIVNKGTPKEFEMNDIYLYELGIRKTKYWAYENEWRFKASPFIENHGSNKVIGKEMQFDMKEYIDIPLKTQIEEILLAPQMKEEDEEKVRKFLNDNYPEIDVRKSKAKTNFIEKR